MRETRVLVKLVPMLAPITIGMAMRTSKTKKNNKKKINFETMNDLKQGFSNFYMPAASVIFTGMDN